MFFSSDRVMGDVLERVMLLILSDILLILLTRSHLDTD